VREPLFPESTVLAVLRRFNPWWDGRSLPEAPEDRRDLFTPLWESVWVIPADAPILMAGIRGAGKTTLLLQLARDLLRAGAPARNVVYAPMDHPVLSAAGLEGVVQTWSHATPPSSSHTFLLLDEAEFSEGWEDWLRRHASPELRCRIVATVSVAGTPPSRAPKETPWRVMRVPPLTFSEYVARRGGPPPGIVPGQNLRELFAWDEGAFRGAAAAAHPLVTLFNQYLVEGGFPGVLGAPGLDTMQRILRDDVVVRALRGDATALRGVRRVSEIEQLFLCLCLHDGSPVDVPVLSARLNVSKSTVNKHLELLEAAHLVVLLPQFGYGSEVLRGRVRVCLTEPALLFAMLVRGQDALEDDALLRVAVEGCVFKHLYNRDAAGSLDFTYWRDGTDDLVRFVATGATGASRPFDVVYGDGITTGEHVRGLRKFCEGRDVKMAYVITKRLDDFGPLPLASPDRRSNKVLPVKCMRIPAPLFCYWR
jgi:uncharacterized protein